MPDAFCATIEGMTDSVGERLREIRKELARQRGIDDLTQREFAKEIGIEPGSLSDLERGVSKAPSSGTLLRMRDKGVNPDYVMHGKGPKLLNQIERQLNQQTLMSMLGDLDDDDQQVLIDMAKALARKKGKRSSNDPFGEDPPG